MVTRLRNPDSKLSQRRVMQDKDSSSQDGSKALKEVRHVHANNPTPIFSFKQFLHMDKC